MENTEFLVTASVQVSYKELLETYRTLIDFNPRIHKENDGSFEYMVIEIETLRDLLALQHRLDEELIIGDVTDLDVKGVKKQIQIYDGYIE